MKKTIVLMMLAQTVLTCLQAQTPQALEVKELTLSNGMSVWLNEDHSQPKVFGAVVVNAGAKDCPNTGIAHYFEHIMFKGTDEIGTIDYQAEKPWLDSISACYDKLSATKDPTQREAIQKDINRLSQIAGEYAIPNEFNRLISKYGGTGLNAGTSWDFTYYHNSFIPQYMEQWCQLNSDRLINPVFRLFQGELEAVYEEKNMYADNMLSTAMDKMLAELFGDRPYAYPIIGSTENLKNPRQSDMREFYAKYYVGCNMGLILCGDFDANSILPLLERTFGRIPKGTPPTHPKSPMPDITKERTVEVKIPIPLVSLEMLAFKAPTEFEKDANTLKIAMSLLSNGQAGMLDSLTNEGTLMAALGTVMGLNDAGLAYVLIVPNLLASTNKAEKACMEQIARLRSGQFSDVMFNTQKQEAYREAKRELETISERAEKMVMVMSSGHTWKEYLDLVNQINHITKSDVIRAAERYLGAPFVRFKKKKGEYEKDKMTQPGYKPVVPKHKNAESAYAKRLAQIPVKTWEPRLLDFDHDATMKPLGGQANLYTVNNPVNDLFELSVIYNKGTKADKILEASELYLNTAGTDSLTRQQFETAMQNLGASVVFSTTQSDFKIIISGVDEHFDATLQLVSHLLHHAKSTPKVLSQIRDSKKADSKSESTQNTDVMRALIQKVVYGDQSTYLTHLTTAEIKKLKGEEMYEAFKQVLSSACNIVYSGTLPISDVEKAVRRHLPVSLSQEAYKDYSSEVLGYDEPLVYLYDMPKSRQNLFFTYEQIDALPTQEARVPFQLFKEYFGGGMSSILFQEVREFRSMAYTTSSFSFSRSFKLAPKSPLAFGTIVGTQKDKTMGAIALVDSLLRHAPIQDISFQTAKQSIVNEICNEYPSFRNIGQAIASHRWKGYTEDSKTGLAQAIQNAKMEDMVNYYERQIRDHGKHRVIGIVGDKSKLDLKELEKYGRIIMVQKSDLFKK